LSTMDRFVPRCSHIDDAASKPQSALASATFSWLIYSTLWPERCSECGCNSMVMIPDTIGGSYEEKVRVKGAGEHNPPSRGLEGFSVTVWAENYLLSILSFPLASQLYNLYPVA